MLSKVKAPSRLAAVVNSGRLPPCRNRLIEAFGTAAPEGSTTDPFRRPLVCGNANNERNKKSAQSRPTTTLPRADINGRIAGRIAPGSRRRPVARLGRQPERARRSSRRASHPQPFRHRFHPFDRERLPALAPSPPSVRGKIFVRRGDDHKSQLRSGGAKQLPRAACV